MGSARARAASANSHAFVAVLGRTRETTSRTGRTESQAAVTVEAAPVMAMRTRRRQVHLWLSEREYTWVRTRAVANDESISATLRHLVVAAGRVGGGGWA